MARRAEGAPGVSPSIQRLFRDIDAPQMAFTPLAGSNLEAIEAWRARPAFAAHREALRRTGDERGLQTLELAPCRKIGRRPN
jgi:hypothetical protein